MTAAAEPLLTICRQLIDPHAQPLAIHPGHDGTIAVRAATVVGDVVIKVHRARERHHQEVHAYERWIPALDGRAPRLLAVSDEPPAIIISAMPGRPLVESSLTAAQEAEAHRQAGSILRDFHDAAPARAEPDMTAWLAERGECWLALADATLPAQQRKEIRAHLRALTTLGPIAAVPCHLDYTPRNLLCTTAPEASSQHDNAHADASSDVAVSAIDYEHARYDLAARDLVRLSTRIWVHRPDLEAAFLTEYGPISDLDREIIDHCSHFDALTAAVRSAQRARRTVSHVVGGAG